MTRRILGLRGTNVGGAVATGFGLEGMVVGGAILGEMVVGGAGLEKAAVGGAGFEGTDVGGTCLEKEGAEGHASACPALWLFCEGLTTLEKELRKEEAEEDETGPEPAVEPCWEGGGTVAGPSGRCRSIM